MPARNEAGGVDGHVRRLLASPVLGERPVRRIIVVDNASTDDTAGAARAAGAEVVSEPRRGYGWACLTGVRAAAEGDVVLLMDADGSDDPRGAAQVAALVLTAAADLALGSRTRGRAERGALTPQQRAGNAVGVSLLRLLTGARLTDLGPQPAMRRGRLLALAMREMTYGWSTEMLIKALRAGYRVAEVPVDYHRRAGGVSKVSGTLRGTVGASWSILSTIARYARWQPPTQAP